MMKKNMPLDQALDNMNRQKGLLRAAFKDVAAALATELPELWDDAMEIWDDEEQAARFLCKPHMNLNGAVPVELARSGPEQRQQVRDFLCRIKYGVY